MAREFSAVEEWELWIPDVGGERELYKENPGEALTMELRFMTKAARDEYHRKFKRALKMGISADSASDKMARDMITDNVRNVRGYVVNGETVATGEQLADVVGDDALLKSVVEAISDRSSLDEGLAKKLRSGSASTSKGPQTNATGGAAVVTPRSQVTTQGGQQSPATYDCPTP